MPNEETIPIVFVHVGSKLFLQESVAQARVSNPASPIIVIGKDLCPLPDYCEIVDIEQFKNRHLFRLAYRHFSYNGYAYELFCFQRWIVMRDFMRRRKLTRCLYLDSDVMLYSNATIEAARFEAFDVTCNRPPGINASPHCCFVMNGTALTKYVRLLLRINLTPGGLIWLYKKFNILGRPFHCGGVNDMTLFALADDRRILRVANMNTVQPDGTLFDGTIARTDGMVLESGLKKITWQNGIPYATERDSGRLIRMHTLHFQGASKSIMSSYRSTANTSAT